MFILFFRVNIDLNYENSQSMIIPDIILKLQVGSICFLFLNLFPLIIPPTVADYLSFYKGKAHNTL